MPKKIKSWEEMVGLESENYKLEVKLLGEGGGCAHIVRKGATGGDENFFLYLSTHTFYPSHYKWATQMLQKLGFDVELVPDE